MSVLDGRVRSADAIANTNCEILVIDRRDFLPFVHSQPALAMKFIELLCGRLRWTSDQVEQIILQDLPGRLASALLGLTEKRKLENASRTIAITQQEISEMVGTRRARASTSSSGRGRRATGYVSNMAPSSCSMPTRFANCRRRFGRGRVAKQIFATMTKIGTSGRFCGDKNSALQNRIVSRDIVSTIHCLNLPPITSF